ncbi:MAG TPA: hypothetical protein VEP90_21860 [Methylomirabilota bacterium]|nr:hypothetical protein [Methylomirabilota bacterium]
MTKITEKHLLWWIFEANRKMGRDLVKYNFDQVNAPDWVWKTYEEKKQEWDG